MANARMFGVAPQLAWALLLAISLAAVLTAGGTWGLFNDRTVGPLGGGVVWVVGAVIPILVAAGAVAYTGNRLWRRGDSKGVARAALVMGILSAVSIPAAATGIYAPLGAGALVLGGFTGRQLGAAGAFGMAAVSTALPWIRGPGLVPYSPLDADGLFWFGGQDGLVILVAAAVGVFLAFRRIWPGVAVTGAALLVVAALEWGYIADRELHGEYVVPCVDPGNCLNPAEGVYVLGIAAAAAAVLGIWGSVAAVRNYLRKTAPAARRQS